MNESTMINTDALAEALLFGLQKYESKTPELQGNNMVGISIMLDHPLDGLFEVADMESETEFLIELLDVIDPLEEDDGGDSGDDDDGPAPEAEPDPVVSAGL